MAEENLSLQLDMLDMADASTMDHHVVHDSEEHPQPTTENCNLIVNYLPHDIDDLSLKGLFVEFGEIVMTKVVTDRNTKKSLGYGFVKFAREDDARRAIQKLNGFTIDHKCLKVSVARPPSLEIRNCKLYVTNLPKEYSEQDVINLFKEFGEIIECRVLKDKNSRTNKGVAFVQFDNKTQANNALSLNGCQLEGGSRGLGVKYAEDQHKKREMARLQSLTTHNVYRYLGGPATPHDLPMDPYRVSPRSGERPLQSPYHYQAYPSPTHPHVHLSSHPSHSPATLPHHAPPAGPSAVARSPIPPPSPSAQGYHGLGGINAVYGTTGGGGGGANPAPSLHHLQVPPVTLQVHPPGAGVASPVMGAVSPNHFLYQQQQMLQAQLTGTAPSPQTPMMSPSYSPRSVRRSNPGRGGHFSGGGGGNGYFDSADMQPSPASYAQQAPQHVPGAGQQYNNWYSVTPPQQHQHQQPHQAQMSYHGPSGAGTGNSPVLSGLTPQQQVRHMPMHNGVSVDLGVPTGLPAQPQRSPAMRPSPLTNSYGHSPQPQSHHASPHMQMQMPPSPAGQSMYASAGGHPTGPALQPSPYLSSSAHYYSDGGRAPQNVFPHYGGSATGGGSGSVALSIANLPPHADVALLHDLFAPYGRVLSAQIDVDAGGAAGGQGPRGSQCSGRGRVQVATINQAEAACQALGGMRVGELPLQVNILGGGAALRK